jgi:hypothetical protein
MVDAHDAIPAEGIYLVGAFESVFRKQTPDWQNIEQRAVEAAKALLGCSDDPSQREQCQRDFEKAKIPLDDAHFKANEWLRSHIIDGALTAYIRNPVTDKLLRLPRTGWGMVLEKSIIETDFVGPDDMEAPGPDTVIDGARRPVFFKAAEFQQLLEAEVGAVLAEALQPVDYRTGYPGRPSVQHLVEAEIVRRTDDATYISSRKIED